MIFDMVLNSAFSEPEEDDPDFQIPRLCEHCHRKIKGKQYQIGKYVYDKQCYQFRYILEKAQMEEERRMELKKKRILGEM